MRPGDNLSGYRLTTPFTTTGGGHCQWAFAVRDGEEFFVKQFLTPTYPLPDGPGSEKTKAAKRARCERFAGQHNGVKEKLRPLSATGGNLVVARDFFRHDAHYYKVTAKVEVGSEEPQDIAALPIEERLTLLLKVTNSLGILHGVGLVHGDIKPPNILIERTAHGLSTKLIDFDNCYFAADPPPPDELVGDLVYYAPEMIDYMVGAGEPGLLIEKSDMFALGLTFAQYLTGRIPAFDPEHKYPGEALRRGSPVRPELPPEAAAFGDLLAALLQRDPGSRPSCRETRDRLQLIRRGLRPGGEPKTDPAVPGLLGGTLFKKIGRPEPAEPEPTGGLKGSLLRKIGGAESADPAPGAPPSGGLKGSLIRKRRAAEGGDE